MYKTHLPDDGLTEEKNRLNTNLTSLYQLQNNKIMFTEVHLMVLNVVG